MKPHLELVRPPNEPSIESRTGSAADGTTIITSGEPLGYSRRDFIGLVTVGALGVAGAYGVATFFKLIYPPGRSLEGRIKPGWVKVAKVSELDEVHPQLVPYGEEWAYLIRRGRTVLALDAACPHVRCKLAWDAPSRRYRCPCHKSAFTIAGERLYGPSNRDMAAMKVSVEGPDVLIGGWLEGEV